MKYATILSLSSVATAAPLLSSRGSCNEGVQKICYGVDGGQSQNVDPEDVQFAADYLRHIGQVNKGADKFWNMPKDFDCPEWTMPVDGGSLLVIAKHNSARYASSILYEDFATAIDGGPHAGAAGKKKAFTSCGAHGGQIGVVGNKTNPIYSTEEYKKAGAKPDGIVMKIVKAPKN